MPNFGHFTLFPIFSYQSDIKWFRTPQLWSFCTFSDLFPQKWSKTIGMLNFAHFTLFAVLFHQSGPKRFGMPNFGHLTPFPIFSYQSGIKSFRTPSLGHSTHFLIFSHQSVPKWFRMPNFGHFTFPTKSSSDWLRMANFTRFAPFPIFSHRIGSFFLPNLKVFISWGGGTLANFPRFCNFSNHF